MVETCLCHGLEDPRGNLARLQWHKVFLPSSKESRKANVLENSDFSCHGHAYLTCRNKVSLARSSSSSNPGAVICLKLPSHSSTCSHHGVVVWWFVRSRTRCLPHLFSLSPPPFLQGRLITSRTHQRPLSYRRRIEHHPHARTEGLGREVVIELGPDDARVAVRPCDLAPDDSDFRSLALPRGSVDVCDSLSKIEPVRAC